MRNDIGDELEPEAVQPSVASTVASLIPTKTRTADVTVAVMTRKRLCLLGEGPRNDG